MTGSERGMTIVEVMVAALVTVIGGLAVLSLVDASARSTFRSEQTQSASGVLQQEMEKIKSLDYGQVALTSVPASSTDPGSPASRVSSGGFITTPATSSTPSPFVLNGQTDGNGAVISAGAVNPGPTAFQQGDIKGLIYRYVVWKDDPTCSETLCPGSKDLKRIVVAVDLADAASGGQRTYQELQAQIADPDAKPVTSSSPPRSDSIASNWTFWLTDTTCDHSDRLAITGDHLTHNTRGNCTTGQTTGNSPGAPDLMLTEAPPLAGDQTLRDYATDVEPTTNTDLDKGLQVRRGASGGCPDSYLAIDTQPNLSEPDLFQKVHKWVSPAIPNGFEVRLDGQGTLSLWTSTINSAVVSGKICIWLFVRQTNNQGVRVDTPAVNLTTSLNNFQYSKLTWPATWSEIQVPLSFVTSTHLLPGTRLGVAVAVERTGSNGDGLQFLYDEPSFDSKLVVPTYSTLPF